MITATRSVQRDWVTGCMLLLVLIITRSGHFGTSLKLPDASWAVFWLSGAFAIRWWWTAIFMVAAAIVDYIVISHGVSSYCVTPAYPFLIPTYAALWGAGRWVSQSLGFEWQSLLRVAVSVLNGVTVAFIISNYSFYLFSGNFASLTTWQFTQATMQYWPAYLLHVTVYVVTGLLIHSISEAIRTLRAPQKTAAI